MVLDYADSFGYPCNPEVKPFGFSLIKKIREIKKH